jgi:hypothetical protein
MVTSELRDGIVWITIEGEMVTKDIKREAGKWLQQKDSFCGFITDLRDMNPIPTAGEQREIEAWRERNKSGKPHALLGRTNALGALVSIYVRLTKARDTRYFMSAEAAIKWVRSFEP